jgi:hypothetical protein
MHSPAQAAGTTNNRAKARFPLPREGAEARPHGSVRRQALRTKNRDVAEQTLKSFVAQYEIANRPDNITVEYVWNGYWKSLGVKPATSTMRYEGKAVLPFFGVMAADAIAEDDCRAYRAARLAAGRKDGTIWTELCSRMGIAHAELRKRRQSG